MKVLAIINKISSNASGGDKINHRNMLYLKQIFGSDLLLYEIKTSVRFVKKFLDHLFFYAGGVSGSDVKNIDRLMRTSNFDIIFLGHSLFGRLCKRYHSQSTIITYFHNVERNYAIDYFRKFGFSKLLFLMNSLVSEKLSVKFSNYLICISEFDSNMLQKIYKRNADCILPTTLVDTYRKTKSHAKLQQPYLLFVGSYFFGNIHGIKWFVNTILPKISCKTVICGKGMSALACDITNDSDELVIFDFVDDLNVLYANASAVISPIFIGSGMKTKIAEALMHGKILLGTKEAFEGYKINNEFMKVLTTEEEWIREIENCLSTPIFLNHKARAHFLEYYSENSQYEKFKEFIDGNTINKE